MTDDIGLDKLGQPGEAAATTDHPGAEERPPLFLVKGDATPEEIAALAAVLQALAAVGAQQPPPRPRSEWAHPRRSVRSTPPSGRGGWRASSLPR